MKASEIPNLFQAEVEIMYETKDGYILSQKLIDEQKTYSFSWAKYKVAVIRIEEMPPCKHEHVHTNMQLQYSCRHCGVKMEPTGFRVAEETNK